jgi:hypothetical protein
MCEFGFVFPMLNGLMLGISLRVITVPRVLGLLLIGLMLTHSSHAAAGAFRMPGQEILGKWKVVSHDVRGLKQPLGEDFFMQMNKREEFLPIGMIIEIEGGYKVSYVPRSVTLGTRVPYSAPDIGLRFIAPVPAEICKNERWNYLCDDLKNLKMNQDFGGQIFFEIGTNDLNQTALWPTMSVILYKLILDSDKTLFVRLLSPDRLVAPFWYRAPGTSIDLPVGVIFKRIKN